MLKFSNKKIFRLVGIIILIIILSKVDFQKITAYFSNLNIMFFAVINLLILPALFIKSSRWRYLLHLQGINYSANDSFFSYLGGICAGIVTPGRIGETVKAIYLKQEKNISLSEGLASVFIDRFFDFYILVLLGSIGFFHFLNIKNVRYDVLVFLILFLFLFPFLLFNKAFTERTGKIIYKSMISGLDQNFFEGQFKSFFSAVKKIILQRVYLPFVLTILAYLLYFWQCYLLAHLASIDISYMTVMFFVSVANLVSIIPITILGIGTREASLIYLFSMHGLNAEGALVYSFLLFVSFYLISGLLGFVGWFVKGKNIKAVNKNG